MSIPQHRRSQPLHALMLLALFGVTFPAAAQDLADDMVGQNEEAWTVWKAAIRSVEREQTEQAEKQLQKLAEMKLSPLRLALMADRTGALRLEQLAESGKASDTAKSLVADIKSGRRQRALAEDGWHYAAIGQFKYADAAFKALIDSQADPVALLELARMNKNRHNVLTKLMANVDVGPSARKMIDLLSKGEQMLRIDPYEIAANVQKLTGGPRMNFNAVEALKVSGEYAIPHMIQFLQDATKQELHPVIIKALPQIGRPGLNPLCVALKMQDEVTRQILIKTVAEIGYRQALPYLAEVANDPAASGATRALAQQAMRTIRNSEGQSVSDLFLELADAYYGGTEDDSLGADPRQDQANVWYFMDGMLKYVSVPREIFSDIMTIRCCEEALQADADNTQAVALWVAGNFRREAKLGMNVESDSPDPLAARDGTRPDNYPRAIYFARAAGPMYNQMVLARAVRDRDAGVALGAIAALATTAGENSLVGAEDLKQPLVQCLTFPSRLVRVKGGLALGRARPKTPFDQAENVIPVLAEALSQPGARSAMIVDANEDLRNQFLAFLRATGAEVAAGGSLFEATGAGRKAGISSYDVIMLSSDMTEPGVLGAVGELRRGFETAATPILIIVKPGQPMGPPMDAKRLHAGVEILDAALLATGDPGQIAEKFSQTMGQAARALGMTSMSDETALDLAIQAADVIRMIAESNLKVYDPSRATQALINALKAGSETLRIRAAHALALLPNTEAQSAIAEAAISAGNSPAQRVSAFGSLAESARRNGRLLSEELIQQVISTTMAEKDLVLRTAASQALGALDLPSNKASEIIRAQSRE